MRLSNFWGTKNSQYCSEETYWNIAYGYEVLRAFAHNEKPDDALPTKYSHHKLPQYQKAETNEIVSLFFRQNLSLSKRLFEYIRQCKKNPDTNEELYEQIYQFFYKLCRELWNFETLQQRNTLRVENAFDQVHRDYQFYY